MSRWRELSGDQQRAGALAAALALAMLLPWYRTSYPVTNPTGIAHDSLSAFEAFSWVEAGVLVVAAAILYLLWARSQRRAFHLPGGDGWAVTLGGAWVVFLLIWRLFDKPAVERGTVGVSWGLFVAMAVGAALMAAGQRMRAAQRPEPPNPAADDPTWEQPRRRRTDRPGRRPVDPHAVTRALRDEPPAWEGEPPEPPRRARPATGRLPHRPAARDEPDGDPTRRLFEDPDPPPAADPPDDRLF
jgi:hypothetical protein